MDSPSYLEPAIGLRDWIIWGRLESNSSGIHRLLKAIWQCFHTLISVASPLTVSGGCQNKQRFLLDILTYGNIKQLITVESVVCGVMSGAEILASGKPVLLVFSAWEVSPPLPAWIICVFLVPVKWRDLDFQLRNKNSFFFLDWVSGWIKEMFVIFASSKKFQISNVYISLGSTIYLPVSDCSSRMELFYCLCFVLFTSHMNGPK